MFERSVFSTALSWDSARRRRSSSRRSLISWLPVYVGLSAIIYRMIRNAAAFLSANLFLRYAWKVTTLIHYLLLFNIGAVTDKTSWTAKLWITLLCEVRAADIFMILTSNIHRYSPVITEQFVSANPRPLYPTIRAMTDLHTVKSF